MAFGFAKTRYSPIAVDFGADSLKLLQVAFGEAPALVAAFAQPLPESARGDAHERVAFIERVIKEMLKDPAFHGRRVMSSIPAFQTLVHHLEIPHVGEGADLETQIGLQLRERLEVEPTRMVMRSFQLGPVVRDGVTRQRVLCLAAKRDAVMGYIELLRRCKLEVVGMHSEPLCLIRAFSHLYRREADQQRTTCFMDIGAATTKVVIAHGCEMVLAKSIHIGGDAITRQFAAGAKLSFAEARQARMENGFAAGGIGGGGEGGGGRIASPAKQPEVHHRGSALAMMLADEPDVQLLDENLADSAAASGSSAVASGEDDTAQCLIDELRLCIRYYQNLYPDRRIEKLVFVGGEAANTALCRQVAEATRLPAQIGDPLARLIRDEAAQRGVDLAQPQPGWAVPMGLCLSEANL